jgi:hypothetical protein
MVVCLDVLVRRVYQVKAVCKIEFLIHQDMTMRNSGGRNLPGLRGEPGRDGIPGQPGLR